MNPTATSAVLGPDIIAGQQEYLLPSMLHLYSEPLCLTEGQGVRVRDENGSEYLDLFSGILTTSVGHCHPRVVDAMTDQMGRLGHVSTLYANAPQVEAAQKIANRNHRATCCISWSFVYGYERNGSFRMETTSNPRGGH